MPVQVAATAQLPYFLRLGNQHFGQLEVSQAGDHTQVRVHFQANLDDTPDQRQQTAARQAKELLRQTNHLLRWYRFLTKNAAMVELTQARLSPIGFVQTADNVAYHEDLNFKDETPRSDHLTGTELEIALQNHLNTGQEPPLAEMMQLDAKMAKIEGRFREAVLFSWSAIDSLFNTAYDRRIQAISGHGLGDSKEWFMGKQGEMPLKIKMTGMLYLLTQNSFSFDSKKWQNLVVSYKKRNEIIHRAGHATEEDASQALEVTQWVTVFLQNLDQTEQSTPDS